MAAVFSRSPSQQILPPFARTLLLSVILLAVPIRSNEDVMILPAGSAFSWGKWTVVSDEFCVYLSRGRDDAVVIKLNEMNDGGFMYHIINETDLYMKPGGWTINVEPLGVTKRHLDWARTLIKKYAPQPRLSNPGPYKLIYGEWIMSCIKEHELLLQSTNSEAGASHIILKDDLPGFIFVTNDFTHITKTYNDESENNTSNKTLELNSNGVSQAEGSSEDAVSLLAGFEYSWGKWSMIHDRMIFYLCRCKDDVVIQLSYNSNGSIRYLINGTEFIIHENGTNVPSEGNITNVEYGIEGIRGPTRNYVPQPILSLPGRSKLKFGRWTLSWMMENRLMIHNKDVRIILIDDLPGFIYATENNTHITKTYYNESETNTCNATLQMNSNGDRRAEDSSLIPAYNIITKKKIKKGNKIIKVSISTLNNEEILEGQYVVEKDNDETLTAAKDLFEKLEQAFV